MPSFEWKSSAFDVDSSSLFVTVLRISSNYLASTIRRTSATITANPKYCQFPDPFFDASANLIDLSAISFMALKARSFASISCYDIPSVDLRCWWDGSIMIGRIIPGKISMRSQLPNYSKPHTQDGAGGGI